MTDNSKVIMTKESRRRLQKDIVEIIKNPLMNTVFIMHMMNKIC